MKALILQSLDDVKLDASGYTIYFNTNYYSTYAVLSCYRIILDSVTNGEPIPQWWYEINKTEESISLYEMFTHSDSEDPVMFVDKLVYFNKLLHYHLAHMTQGDYESQMRLIEHRMRTLVTSTENILDALLK